MKKTLKSKVQTRPVRVRKPITRKSKSSPDDHDYEPFLERVRIRFNVVMSLHEGKMFTTDVESKQLWKAYIAGFPASMRQHYNCNTCRHFIERFGGLVAIDPESGITQSVIWNKADAPSYFKPDLLISLVESAKVTGVFLTSNMFAGTSQTDEWKHLSLVFPREILRKKNLLQTDHQAMAEKREDWLNMKTALVQFGLNEVDKAISLLKTDQLYRGEKCLGQAEWLRNVIVAYREAKAKHRDNILWTVVASAPTGFCHPRSSMIGTLLEDIWSGLDINSVKKRFAEKMHPLQYMRPQAAPSDGNIQLAEKIVEKLGIKNSLRRRYAKLEEIAKLWTPRKSVEMCAGGVFSHLKSKKIDDSVVNMTPTPITWVKFIKTVLPMADEIKVHLPYTGNYAALVTAVDVFAPPIIRWDMENERNPVSWYLWSGGSPAIQWGLRSGTYHPVTAVTLHPSMWSRQGMDKADNAGAIFILDGARETRSNIGLALFPEILKNELHPIRSTIEAYSKRGTMEGKEDASACGLSIQPGSRCEVTLKVTSGIGNVLYKIDRWD